jgi:DNA repair protein RecO (recombination protein O)
MPQVFGCVKCQKNSTASNQGEEGAHIGKYYFSAASGGILCEACKGYDKNAVRVNTSTVYTMQYIISKEIERLYTFKVTDDVLNELQQCIRQYLDCYIDHEFKSLEMLNQI